MALATSTTKLVVAALPHTARAHLHHPPLTIITTTMVAGAAVLPLLLEVELLGLPLINIVDNKALV